MKKNLIALIVVCIAGYGSFATMGTMLVHDIKFLLGGCYQEATVISSVADGKKWRYFIKYVSCDNGKTVFKELLSKRRIVVGDVFTIRISDRSNQVLFGNFIWIFFLFLVAINAFYIILIIAILMKIGRNILGD